MAFPIIPVLGGLVLILAASKPKKAAVVTGPKGTGVIYNPTPTPINGGGTAFPGTPTPPMTSPPVVSGCTTADSGLTTVQVQTMLRQIGYTLGGYGVDGNCGPATKADITSFQASKGIAQTGIVDASTAAALISASTGTGAGGGGTSPSVTTSYTDANGIPWTITLNSGVYRADPNSKPTADYNVAYTGGSLAEVQGQIDALAAATAGTLPGAASAGWNYGGGAGVGYGGYGYGGAGVGSCGGSSPMPIYVPVPYYAGQRPGPGAGVGRYAMQNGTQAALANLAMNAGRVNMQASPGALGSITDRNGVSWRIMPNGSGWMIAVASGYNGQQLQSATREQLLSAIDAFAASMPMGAGVGACGGGGGGPLRPMYFGYGPPGTPGGFNYMG